jgi:hypothetical protein
MALALGAGALTMGFAAGWFVRSFASTTRGAVVGTIAVAHRAHHDLSRIIGQTREWVEDVVAEGKARYEMGRARLDPETDLTNRASAPNPVSSN